MQVGMLKTIIVKRNLAGDQLKIDDVGSQFGHFINVLEATVLYGVIPSSVEKRNTNAHGNEIETAMVESDIIVARGLLSIIVEAVKKNEIIFNSTKQNFFEIDFVRIAA